MIALNDYAAAMVGALLRRQPLSAGKVAFAWRTVVGAAMGRASVVSLLDDGTLQVVVSDANWRREIRRTSPMFRPRLEALLGPDVIRRVDVRAPERAARATRGRGTRARPKT